MATNTPQIPGAFSAEPRGRPALATIGLALALGGLVLMGFIARANERPLICHCPAGGTSAMLLRPSGTAPAGFVAYSDPRGQFALYVSSTWSAAATTLATTSRPLAATTFAPHGTDLPQWSIATLAGNVPSTQLAAVVGAAIQGQGATSFAPAVATDRAVIGAYEWTHLAATAELHGAPITINAYLRPSTDGSTLVIDESLTILASGPQQQDFTPMLASLTLPG